MCPAEREESAAQLRLGAFMNRTPTARTANIMPERKTFVLMELKKQLAIQNNLL
jgi:hypothetical protein